MANYVPGTPSSTSTLDVTALRKVAHDSKLRIDSVRPSIFTAVKTEFQVVDNQIIITKPGLVLDVTNVGKGQMAQSVRVAMRTPPRKRPRYGDGEAILGNEDEPGILYTEAFYNEIKQGLKMNTWGYQFNDLEHLDYNSGYDALMTNFAAENDDTRYQEALLLTYDEALTYSPVSKTFTFNKNWAIPNLDPADYPAWDISPVEPMADGAVDSDNYAQHVFGGAGTAFSENIADALEAASGTAGHSHATLTLDAMLAMTTWAMDEHVVETVMIDGQPTIVWKLPLHVCGWMRNPNNTSSIGAYLELVENYNGDIVKGRKLFPLEIGRFNNNFLLVADPRCATLTVGGANGSRTLMPGFIFPSNNDDRNRGAWSATSGSVNYVYDISTFMGANAVMKFTRDEMRGGLVETTEYDKIKGIANYKGEGFQIPAWDKGTPTTTSQIQRGSCVVPIGRAPIQTLTAV